MTNEQPYQTVPMSEADDANGLDEKIRSPPSEEEIVSLLQTSPEKTQSTLYHLGPPPGSFPPGTPGASSKTLTRSPSYDVVESPKAQHNTARTLSRLPGWWKKRVRRASVFVARHWIIGTTLSVVMIVLSSIVVGWSLRLGSFGAVQYLDLNVTSAETAVILDANLIAIDSDKRTMTIDWFVQYNCPSQKCTDTNIYFDQNLLRADDSSSVANNEKPPPIFVISGWDYTTRSHNLDYRTNTPEFRTEVVITNYYKGGRSAQAYPFDKYSATLIFFAQRAVDNSSVPLGIRYTSGIVVGFNAALDDDISGSGRYQTLVKNLIITRGQVIRMYAIIIVIAIWLVTLTCVMACIVAVFFGKGVKADLLVIPVTTLFAFTQLRGTMPGAPNGFGADIDFIGILPCLVLLTFCCVFMTAVFLFRDPEKNASRWEDMMRRSSLQEEDFKGRPENDRSR